MSPGMWRWVRWGVFGALAIALVAANIAVVMRGLTTTPLSEQEALHLSVPVNFVAGLGYTSDGTFSGSVLTPFDEFVSAGPTVLLPIAIMIGFGADPVEAGRIVGLVFWMGLIAGLFVVGRAIAGWFGGLIAAASPLLLDMAGIPSPIQGATDVLGAIPAAALLVWAVVVARKKVWVAGLLVGLAIQATTLAALAAPALIVFVVLGWTASDFKGLTKRLLGAAFVALLPTVLFEFAKFVSVGIDDYGDASREAVDFLSTRGQDVDAGAGEKIGVLADAWVLAPWLLVVLGIIVVLGLIAALGFTQAERSIADELIARGRLWTRREITAVIVTAGVGVATFAAWFLLSTDTPSWVRLVSPGLFAFGPLLVAGAWFGLWATGTWGLHVALGLRWELDLEPEEDLDPTPGPEQRVTSVDARRAIEYSGQSHLEGRAEGKRAVSGYLARTRRARVDALHEAGLIKPRRKPETAVTAGAPAKKGAQRQLPPVPGSADEAARARREALAAAAEPAEERSLGDRLGRTGGAVVGVLAVVCAALLAGGIGWGVVERAWLRPAPDETLVEQREAATLIGDALGYQPYTVGADPEATPTPTATASEGDAEDEAAEEDADTPSLEDLLKSEAEEGNWLAVERGRGVSIAFLAGAHVALVDDTDEVVAYPYLVTLDADAEAEEDAEAPCDEEIIRVGDDVVCAAPE